MAYTKKIKLAKCFCYVTHGVYYFTTFVQLCLHDTIDEWYCLLIQSKYIMQVIYLDIQVNTEITLPRSNLDSSPIPPSPPLCG